VRSLALALCLVASAQAVELSDEDRASAKSHTEHGTALYEHGDYEHALAEFSDARRLYAAPELDYDIARCLDRLGRPAEAAAAYERYVAARPFDSKSSAISARAAQLRALASEQAQRPVTVTTAISPPPTTTRRTPVAASAVAGVTGVTAIAGAVLLGVVGGTVSHAEDHSLSHARVDSLKDQAYAGYALLGVAAVAAVVDVALWVRWSKHREVAR
jgi:tetratricopeptide (TPR) repeat protein